MVVSGPKFLQSVLGDLVQIALSFSEGRTLSKAVVIIANRIIESRQIVALWRAVDPNVFVFRSNPVW